MKKNHVIIALATLAAAIIIAGLYLDYRRPAGSGLLSVLDKPETGGEGLDNYGPAPELAGIASWLNSEPLALADLKGKVVLIDFWTYSCINCIRTLPHITKLYEDYKDQGLIVIGVHTPEFAFEKDKDNVARAMKQFGIDYPVAQDNDYATWNAFSNHYWPAKYLIDQDGNVVYFHFGEGAYDATENAVRRLLGLDAAAEPAASGERRVASPEMYFGLERLANLSAAQKAAAVRQEYELPERLPLNAFALAGDWVFDGDKVRLAGETGQIRLKFSAGKVFMVASRPDGEAILDIKVDGVSQPSVTVGASQLYTLFDSEDYREHEIEIDITGAGLEAFTFTFG